MMEQWRDVPGFVGWYQVSDQGRVRSLDRVVSRADGRRHTVRSRMLRPGYTKAGYPLVSLHQPGNQKVAYVHHLVLAAFIGPCPPGQECRHLNGVEVDCRLSNLRWGTKAVNEGDKVEHGTSNHGARNGRAKLTPVAVREIRHLKATGETAAAIGTRFGVVKRTVYDILEGRTWGHVI